MLPFFPEPYPDELLYSVIARYHRWSRNPNYEATFKDLFGVRNASAIIDFPTRIEFLCKQLNPKTKLTPMEIVENHTLLPLYRPFVIKRRRESVINSMINPYSIGGSPIRLLGLRNKNLYTLKYCPKCMDENIQIYGEAYWHRVHQVNEVQVCPHHGDYLINTHIRPIDNRRRFYDLNEIPLLECQERSCENEIYKQVSAEVLWLLNSNNTSFYLEDTKKTIYIF